MIFQFLSPAFFSFSISSGKFNFISDQYHFFIHCKIKWFGKNSLYIIAASSILVLKILPAAGKIQPGTFDFIIDLGFDIFSMPQYRFQKNIFFRIESSKYF